MGYEESREKKKKALIIVLVIMLFVICAAGVVYLVWNWYNNYMAQSIYDGLSQQYVSQVEEQEDDTPQLADNPIDFDALKKILFFRMRRTTIIFAVQFIKNIFWQAVFLQTIAMPRIFLTR